MNLRMSSRGTASPNCPAPNSSALVSVAQLEHHLILRLQNTGCTTLTYQINYYSCFASYAGFTLSLPFFSRGKCTIYTRYFLCSYLIASMGLQVIWSFVLAVLDAYSLVRKKALHNPVLVSLFVVGDWVSLYETLTLYLLLDLFQEGLRFQWLLLIAPLFEFNR